MTDAPKRIWASEDVSDGWRYPRASKFPEQAPCENIEYIRRDAVYDLPEVKALVEAAEQLLPRNLGQARCLSDNAIVPVDMSMGEIRIARAALDAIKAKP